MQKTLLTALGLTLIIFGLAFALFSSYHIDGNPPATAVLSAVWGYVFAIVTGTAFIAVGSLAVFLGFKKSKANAAR